MAIDLVILTAPDGKYLSVQPSHVVALRGRSPGDHGESGRKRPDLMGQGVNCVVFTSDGKFVSVVEHCEDVEQKLRVRNPGMGPIERIPEESR